MLNIKVGVMPGKLSEVVVEEGTKVEKIFEIAGLDVENMEYKLDGRTVNANEEVHSGSLLVAMKKIKGNSMTIKVGVMPGKLQEIIVDNNETVKGVFAIAGLDVEGMEYKLDGKTVKENDYAHGSLLVAMKRIKGNSSEYVSELSDEERESILGVDLPKVIEKEDVELYGTITIVGKTIVSKDLFNSVYELKEEVDIKEVEETPNYAQLPKMKIDTLPMERTYNYKETVERIESLKAELEEQEKIYASWIRETEIRIGTLNKVLDILK